MAIVGPPSPSSTTLQVVIDWPPWPQGASSTMSFLRQMKEACHLGEKPHIPCQFYLMWDYTLLSYYHVVTHGLLPKSKICFVYSWLEGKAQGQLPVFLLLSLDNGMGNPSGHSSSPHTLLSSICPTPHHDFI